MSFSSQKELRNHIIASKDFQNYPAKILEYYDSLEELISIAPYYTVFLIDHLAVLDAIIMLNQDYDYGKYLSVLIRRLVSVENFCQQNTDPKLVVDIKIQRNLIRGIIQKLASFKPFKAYIDQIINLNQKLLEGEIHYTNCKTCALNIFILDYDTKITVRLKKYYIVKTIDKPDGKLGSFYASNHADLIFESISLLEWFLNAML